MIAPIQYFGGKGKLAAKLIPLIPYTKLYCEPFFGAGSIFFRRRQSPIEVVNDLDGGVINLMRVLQSKEAMERLQYKLAFTLYSRSEFAKAIEVSRNGEEYDEVDKAWATYVLHNQGMNGNSNGIRTTVGRWSKVLTVYHFNMAATVSRWWTRFELLPAWHRRLAVAQIDNRCALEVIKYWDTKDTTFYLDPSYIQSTRKSGGYKHEQNDDFHVKLIDLILGCQGAVVISGYKHEIYNRLSVSGWFKVEIETTASSAGRTRGSKFLGKGSVLQNAPRTEVVWRNHNAVQLCGNNKMFDFDEKGE